MLPYNQKKIRVLCAWLTTHNSQQEHQPWESKGCFALVNRYLQAKSSATAWP